MPRPRPPPAWAEGPTLRVPRRTSPRRLRSTPRLRVTRRALSCGPRSATLRPQPRTFSRYVAALNLRAGFPVRGRAWCRLAFASARAPETPDDRLSSRGRERELTRAPRPAGIRAVARPSSTQIGEVATDSARAAPGVQWRAF